MEVKEKTPTMSQTSKLIEHQIKLSEICFNLSYTTYKPHGKCTSDDPMVGEAT